jgi:hypothetical protein
VGGLQPASQLKLIIIPPPAIAVVFRKDRLLKVCLSDIVVVFTIDD